MSQVACWFVGDYLINIQMMLTVAVVSESEEFKTPILTALQILWLCNEQTVQFILNVIPICWPRTHTLYCKLKIRFLCFWYVLVYWKRKIKGSSQIMFLGNNETFVHLMKIHVISVILKTIFTAETLGLIRLKCRCCKSPSDSTQLLACFHTNLKQNKSVESLIDCCSHFLPTRNLNIWL